MRKFLTKREIEIVMMVDRNTGVLNLRVFATHPKKRRAEIFGTATLRMEDLREVAAMLTERLQIEDQLVKAE
jgi:hypothetical protein